jgi:hypothetical protein
MTLTQAVVTTAVFAPRRRAWQGRHDAPDVMLLAVAAAGVAGWLLSGATGSWPRSAWSSPTWSQRR